MKRYLIVLATAVLFNPFVMFAQQPMNEEEAMEKNLEMVYEVVEQIIDRDTKVYELEDWQVFKIDSLLVHDYLALIEERNALSKKGVEKADYYIAIQDKWSEQIYNSYRTILNDEQWAKYLKSGAAKEKKARDRRAAQTDVKKK